MRYYNKQHEYYCGIDLHTKSMYVCILDQTGKIVLHQNIPTDANLLLKTILPFMPDIVIAVECIFLAGTGLPISVKSIKFLLFWDTCCI